MSIHHPFLLWFSSGVKVSFIIAFHHKSDRSLNSPSLKNNQPRTRHCLTKIKIQKKERFGFSPAGPRGWAVRHKRCKCSAPDHLCVLDFHMPPHCYGRRTEGRETERRRGGGGAHQSRSLVTPGQADGWRDWQGWFSPSILLRIF